MGAPHGSASRERLTGAPHGTCKTPDDGFVQPVIRPYNSPAERRVTGSSNPSSGFIMLLQKRGMTGSSNPSSSLIISCKTPGDGFVQPLIRLIIPLQNTE